MNTWCTANTRVVKIGGSLLSLGDLKDRLTHWSRGQSRSTRQIFVVGGGGLVDHLRELDRIHHLDEAVCHRAALAAMAINTRLVAKLLGWPVTSQFAELKSTADPCVLFDMQTWPEAYRHGASWELTSDSLAALLAKHLPAGELILLKSCSPITGNSLERSDRIVDEWFAEFAKGIASVGVVNFRVDPERLVKFQEPVGDSA